MCLYELHIEIQAQKQFILISVFLWYHENQSIYTTFFIRQIKRSFPFNLLNDVKNFYM